MISGYVQAEEVATKWNVSIRQVQILCKEGRIEGVVKFGTTWAIPTDAKKPTRTGKGKPGRKPKGQSNNIILNRAKETKSL